MKIIAKIESTQDVAHMEEILDEADGVMVARGDLGVEVPLEEVPVLQKRMIKLAEEKGKICITATQMLDSMIHNPFPTRAEVSDNAWAIDQGTDSVMLSGESANGDYPAQSVAMQTRIAVETEKHFNYISAEHEAFETSDKTVSDAIASAVSDTALLINASLIVCFSISGKTAIRISKTRPVCPIFVVSSDIDTLKHIMLYYGCYPYHVHKVPQFSEDMEVLALKIARDYHLPFGSRIIMTGGTPVGAGKTNFLKVLTLNKPGELSED